MFVVQVLSVETCFFFFSSFLYNMTKPIAYDIFIATRWTLPMKHRTWFISTSSYYYYKFCLATTYRFGSLRVFEQRRVLELLRLLTRCNIFDTKHDGIRFRNSKIFNLLFQHTKDMDSISNIHHSIRMGIRKKTIRVIGGIVVFVEKWKKNNEIIVFCYVFLWPINRIYY